MWPPSAACSDRSSRSPGLTAGEARDLALLLRSGSLAAPIEVVEERVIGPSLGQDNIDKGVRALEIGMLAVFVFMALYYHAFGLVADAVLLANVVLLTALLSLLRASLSLPGIAGIILTVGIAVDANVLIYERIREELRNGVSPQAAIRAGFDKAFSAIADSNVTALIAGLALWVIGTGAMRGFAIVLVLGIATSMFTSLLGSRALITLMYGGRQQSRPAVDRIASRSPLPKPIPISSMTGNKISRGILSSRHQLSVHVHPQGVVRAVGGADRDLDRVAVHARTEPRRRLHRRRDRAGELPGRRQSRRGQPQRCSAPATPMPQVTIFGTSRDIVHPPAADQGQHRGGARRASSRSCAASMPGAADPAGRGDRSAGRR